MPAPLAAQQRSDAPSPGWPERLQALEKRLEKLEQKQDQILENQQTILEQIKNLRVWVRRN